MNQGKILLTHNRTLWARRAFWLSCFCCWFGIGSLGHLAGQSNDNSSTAEKSQAGQSGSGQAGSGQQEPPNDGQPDPNRTQVSAYLVHVPLPINTRVASEVSQSLQQLRDKTQAANQGDARPIVVLQFETDRGGNGAGSSFTACLELAQLLTSPDMNRLRTVAYVPGNRVPVGDAPPAVAGSENSAKLIGHAVLVAIAAEELAIDESAKLGSANVDEPQVNLLAIDVYRNLAERRLSLPVEVVTAMIDPRQSLYRVTLADSERLVDQATLEQLERAGSVVQSETLTTAGSVGEFTAATLARLSVNVQPVQSRQQLANRLRINLAELDSLTLSQRQWKAVEYRLSDYLDQRSADWAIRALDQSLRIDGVNLLIIQFDLFDADIDAALRLTSFLASLDSDQVRTVAFVEQPLAGPAAVCALICDHLLMTTQATIGGEYSYVPDEENLQRVLGELKVLAAKKQRSYSLLKYQLEPTTPLIRWRNTRTGEIQWMVAEEQQLLADSAVWQPLETLAAAAPITAEMAERDGLARSIIRDSQELQSYYSLAEPARVLTPTRADRVVQWLARSLASPGIAFWLLFGGMFLISTEMSTPGLGVPGFLGALCFVLFFWSQYLGGNAGWLEILLFVLGVVFVGLELFVLPGFGVFGIGGLLMIVISIVLASQTFIIPQNAKEFRQLPISLGMVCGALLGFLTALYFLRRYLPHTPFFKKLMLQPPALAAEGFAVESESTLFPVGIRGKTVTRLMPSGKARIGGRVVDVMTDGRIVDSQQTVEVIEAIGNRIVVVPVNEQES